MTDRYTLPANAQLQRPGWPVRLALLALVVIVPLTVASVDRALDRHVSAGVTWTSLAVLAVLVGAIWAVMDWALRRQQLTVSPNGLEVKTGFCRRQWGWDALQLGQARIVDLDEHVELKPRRKRNGMAMPGLKSGWFILRNGQRALVSVRGGHQVLWLPTADGTALLLETPRSRSLLDALTQLAPNPPRA